MTVISGALTGSSPLTRGKHVQCTRPVGARGLIPAHAGKTYRAALGRSVAAAHPRSRGENAGRCFCRVRLARLIPAHAGKTNLAKHLDGLCWAHPRSRGENDAALPRPLRNFGSSPLTRGKLYLEAARGDVCRLIPAHAGKTR